MTNENETVEQIHDELKHDPLAPDGAKPWTHYLAERILAAYKREITAKDAKIASLHALVGKLADTLEKIDNMCDGDMCKLFISTKHCSCCKYLKDCQTGIAHNTLIKHKSEIAKVQTFAND